jgi:hypothetical protein
MAHLPLNVGEDACMDHLLDFPSCSYGAPLPHLAIDCIIGDPQLGASNSIHLGERFDACPAAFDNSQLALLKEAEDLPSVPSKWGLRASMATFQILFDLSLTC